MSRLGHIESLLGVLPPDTRRVFREMYRLVLRELRIGPVSHQAKAENFNAYLVLSTTTSSSNTEFSIEHGMGVTPHLAIPVFALDSTGGTFGGLTVSRAADASRIYLRATSTSTPFALFVE